MVKYAAEIIKEIRQRGSIEIPKGGFTGEAFERWLRGRRSGGSNEAVSRNNTKESEVIPGKRND